MLAFLIMTGRESVSCWCKMQRGNDESDVTIFESYKIPMKLQCSHRALLNFTINSLLPLLMVPLENGRAC